MKILKSHRKLLFLGIFAVVVGGSALVWQGTPYIFQAFKLSWLFLGIVIAIIATPLGNQRLAHTPDEQPALRSGPWVIQIMLIESALLALFWGVCQLNGQLAPILTKPEKHLFINSLVTSCLHMGLFPWTLFALLAIGFAHTAYTKQEDAYTCRLLSPFMRLSPKTTGGIIVDTNSRIVTFFVLASSLAFIILLLANAASHTSLQALLGFHVSAIAACFIMALILISKRLKKALRFLVVEQKLPVAFSLSLIILSLAMILVLLGTLLRGMSQTSLEPPGPIAALLDKGWLTNWHIFMVSWWWMWASVISLLFARISRGRSVRGTLLAILTLPTIISLAVYAAKKWAFDFNLLNSPIIVAIISTAGFIYLISIMTQKQKISMFSQVYLPASEEAKNRSAEQYLQRWLTGLSIIFYVYLPAGIIAVGVFLFLCTIVYSIMTFVVALALLKGLRHN